MLGKNSYRINGEEEKKPSKFEQFMRDFYGDKGEPNAETKSKRQKWLGIGLATVGLLCAFAFPLVGVAIGVAVAVAGAGWIGYNVMQESIVNDKIIKNQERYNAKFRTENELFMNNSKEDAQMNEIKGKIKTSDNPISAFDSLSNNQRMVYLDEALKIKEKERDLIEPVNIKDAKYIQYITDNNPTTQMYMHARLLGEIKKDKSQGNEFKGSAIKTLEKFDQKTYDGFPQRWASTMKNGDKSIRTYLKHKLDGLIKGLSEEYGDVKNKHEGYLKERAEYKEIRSTFSPARDDKASNKEMA